MSRNTRNEARRGRASRSDPPLRPPGGSASVEPTDADDDEDDPYAAGHWGLEAAWIPREDW